MERQNDNDIGFTNNYAQQGSLTNDLEITARQQLQACVEQPELSSNPGPVLEHQGKHTYSIAQEPSHSQTQLEGPVPQLGVEIPPAAPAVNAAYGDPFLQMNNQNETDQSSPPGSGLREAQHAVADAAPRSATLSGSVPPTAIPESLRGNPYRLSDSLTAAKHHLSEAESDAVKSQAFEGQHEARSSDAGSLVEGVETNQQVPSHDAPIEPESSDHHSYHNESERRSSEEESSYDENDCGDDEDDKEFRAQLRSQMAPRFQGEQELRMPLYDPRTGQGQHQPHLQGFGVSGYSPQKHPQAVHPRGFHEHGTRGYQDGMYGIQYLPDLQPFRRQSRSMNDDSMRGPMHMPPASPMFPGSYQDVAQNYQPHASHVQPAMGYQDSRYAMQPYGQYPLAPGYENFPVSREAMQARASSHAVNHGLRKPAAVSQPPKMQQRGAHKSRVVDGTDSTNDDESLRTRAPRHPSIISDSVMGSSPPAQNRPGHHKQQDKDQEPEGEVQFVAAKLKLGFKATKGKKVAPKQHPPGKPKQTQATARKESSSSVESIDWKLPQYEARFEPGATKHDPTVAKVSIPGIIREELLLSPDHAEQETHLLLHLFLPTQQALAVPESKPALAILNFHTVAVMVIEAFVQFEIGDEFGMGRGHWHNNYDEGDADYQRLREAKDADPDEIFFAVIDRWRAGIESNKEPSKLIRGVQEFCDIALDIIHYIKEHGLLKERQRAVRSDKGVNRGAKKVGEDDEAEEVKANKGVKRGCGKVNSPKVTKKAKVEVKAKPKAKEKGGKKKTSTVGVTVIRRA